MKVIKIATDEIINIFYVNSENPKRYRRDEARNEIETIIGKMLEKTKSDNTASEVIEYCEAAIEDAIGCEDGLDGATGEAVLKMIKDRRKGVPI